MGTNCKNGLFNDYKLLLNENENLEIKNTLLKNENKILKAVEAKNEKLALQLQTKTTENEFLAKEIERLKGLLNIDGSNSGIPTSKTPLSKNKVIPNSREKTGKKIGGQMGHPKKKLEAFGDKEVTETQVHTLTECLHCGGNLAETKKVFYKDELDYKVVVIKKRHAFPINECKNCGRESHSLIPNNLKEANQYGSHVRSLLLSFMNIGRAR